MNVTSRTLHRPARFVLLPFILLAAMQAQSCALNVSATESAAALLGPSLTNSEPGYLGHLAELSHCQLKKIDMPLTRVEASFLQKRIQLMLGFIQTPTRDKAGTFYPLIDLKPYWISYAPPPAAGQFQQQIHTDNLQISIVRGVQFPAGLGDAITKLRENGQLDEIDSEMTAIRMLQAQRNHAFLAVDVTYFALKSKGLLGELRGWPLPGFTPLRIGLYLNDETLTPAERKALRNAIKQASKERYIEHLLAKRIGYNAH